MTENEILKTKFISLLQPEFEHNLDKFEELIDDYNELKNSVTQQSDSTLFNALISYKNILDSLQIQEADRLWNEEKRLYAEMIVEENKKTKTIVRKVYWQKQFKKKLAGMSSRVVDEMDSILSHLKNDDDKMLIDFLKNHRWEKLDAVPGNVAIFGIRMLHVDKEFKEHRVILASGDAIKKCINNVTDSENITSKAYYILDYMKDHDYAKMIRNLNLYNKSFVIASIKNSGTPNLTVKQRESYRIDYKPTIVVGTAGSGKTSTAVGTFCDWVERNENILEKSRYAFVTYNKKIRDTVREQISGFLSGQDWHVMSINDFFQEITGDTTISNYDDVLDIEKKLFYDWFKEKYGKESKTIKYINQTKKAFGGGNSDEICYSIFKGIYSGYFYDISNVGNCVDKNTFIKYLETNKIFIDSVAITYIYEICLEFANYIKNTGKLTDNELAWRAYHTLNESSLKRYDYLVVDEVQDLSKIQIYALIRASKNGRASFFGDPFQIINPTVFNFSYIESAYRELGFNTTINQYEEDSQVLSETFRSGDALIKVINTLGKLRLLKLGKLQSFDKPIRSIGEKVDNSIVPLIDRKSEYVDYIIQKAIDHSSCAIIFASENDKEEFCKKYYHLNDNGSLKNRCYTIFEAKGLEFDVCILYKFLKYDKEKYYQILESRLETRDSFIHRIVFNKFFVACTRAIKTFVLLEDEDIFNDRNYPDVSLDDYVKNLDEINASNIESAFREVMSPFDWFYKGDMLFYSNEYDKAIEYFKRGEDYKKEEADDKIELCKILSSANYSNKKHSDEMTALKLKKYKKYDEAAKLFNDLGMHTDELIILSLYLNKKDLEISDISNILSYGNLSFEDSEKLLNSHHFAQFTGRKTELVNKILQLAKGN